MSRINNINKFIVWNLNSIIGLIGILVLVLSLYAVFADWGDLDSSFFLGLGIACALFGYSLILGGSVGTLAVLYQNVRTGFWTGKKILTLYFVIATLLMIASAGLLFGLTNEATSLENARASLLTDNPLPYDAFETAMASKFNEFYFGVAAVCGQVNLIWFWSFIDNWCPESIQEGSCARCGDFWITTCYADETACYSDYDVTVVGGGDSTTPNRTCPYEICRDGVLSYIITRMYAFVWAILTLFLVTFVLVVCSLMLLCFHKRDTVEEMLIKTGAIKRTTALESAQSNAALMASTSENRKVIDANAQSIPVQKSIPSTAAGSKESRSRSANRPGGSNGGNRERK